MTLFSQRNGYVPVEKTLLREVVPPGARTALWNVLKSCIWDKWEDYNYDWTPDSERINELCRQLWVSFYKGDLDQLPPFHSDGTTTGIYNFIKKKFLKCNWYEVFDFIEFLAKAPGSFITSEVSEFVNCVLAEENSAYRLVGLEVIEITDQHQIEAIQKALDIAAPPVKAHINSALALLSNRKAPDYRNSIKESISAVEAVCRELAALPKATLGEALKKIGGLHPALKQGFTSLYGYTNDANGIRHALLDEPNLAKEDAVFMLVVCSAFIGFLHEKERKCHQTSSRT